jgi:hypothetical protein
VEKTNETIPPDIIPLSPQVFVRRLNLRKMQNMLLSRGRGGISSGS